MNVTISLDEHRVRNTEKIEDIKVLMLKGEAGMMTPEDVMDVVEPYLETYAPLNSPALTGTPTAPTAPAGSDTTQIATTAYVKNEVDSKLSRYLTQSDAASTYATQTALDNTDAKVGSGTLDVGSDLIDAANTLNMGLTELNSNLAQISNSIADAFSASESYSEGDYVVYDYSLYKFTADKSAGAWDSSKATPVAVVDELGGGGTTVVPNPSGEATDTLEKLQIDQTIYDFATSNVYGEASGAIASFSDGSAKPLKSLVVDINPIQDLHGYDAPWVGGAGKNKLSLTVANIKAANKEHTWSDNSYTSNGITFTLNANEDGSVTSIIANGTATGNGLLYLFYVEQSQNVPFGGMILSGGISEHAYIQMELARSPWTIYASSKGADATISSEVSEQGTAKVSLFIRVVNDTTLNNAVFKPMIRLASESDATFEPYSNICPISGHTEANVTRCGKNKFDIEGWLNSVVATYTKSGNSYTITARSVLFSKPFTFSDTDVPISISTSSYVGETATNVRMTLLDSNNSIVDSLRANNSYQKKEGLVASKVRFDWSEVGTFTITEPQIELGSTATTYEPYNGQTYNVEFKDGDNPLTVYGGTLDVVSGVLTVDRASVDLGTLAWGLRDSGTVVAPYFFSNIENLGVKYEGNFQTVVYSILCSMYKIVKRDVSAFVDGTICVDGTMGERSVTQLQIKDARYSDAAAFKTAMNGVQLVYELATPITYQLTPTQVKSLLGTNNVWADSGDSDVVYIRDLNLFLNQLDARVKALENA
jgi:hypothetical protein